MGRYFSYIIWKIWNLVFTSLNYVIRRSVSGSNNKSKTAKVKKGVNHEFMYMNKNICGSADKDKKSESSDNHKKYHLLSSQ
jgi:hypothetical protein